MSSDAEGMKGIPIGKRSLDRVGIINAPVPTVFRPFIPAEARLREVAGDRSLECSHLSRGVVQDGDDGDAVARRGVFGLGERCSVAVA